MAMRTFDRTRPGIAAASVGVARRASEEARRYAQERHTFGKPIAEHQAVQFMLADMHKDVTAARLLTWLSAWKIDRGERNTARKRMEREAALNLLGGLAKLGLSREPVSEPA